MDQELLAEHRWLNLAQTALLVSGMVLVLWLSARYLLGDAAGWYVAAVLLLFLWLAPSLSPRLILRMYRAERLTPGSAPSITGLVGELARRAGLERVPEVYYIPSRMLNAFAVGDQENAAIGLTDGLLRRLSQRELAGVLAHELSHIRHNDTRVMGLADTVSRLTEMLSLLGQLLLIVGLPFWLLGLWDVSFLGVALLIFAPVVNALLQLALSRTREFHADLEAARLTSDPGGLAAALAKLERYQGGWLEQVLMPGRRNPDPSLLRTHPRTEERIERLLQLAPEPARTFQRFTAPAYRIVLPPQFRQIQRVPRRGWWGVWM
jgi:heat shock protein HtpX